MVETKEEDVSAWSDCSDWSPKVVDIWDQEASGGALRCMPAAAAACVAGGSMGLRNVGDRGRHEAHMLAGCPVETARRRWRVVELSGD